MAAGYELTSRYRVIREAGHGGMGTVLHAIDLRLGREVALKLLSDQQADRPHAWERIVQEAALASTMSHPNIRAIYDLDYDETRKPFIVMEWLDGETLRQRLYHGNLTGGQLIELAVQIAEGLRAAHDAGVIHRDIKPANLFLNVHGLVKILDFGLATLTAGPALEPTPSDLSLPGVPVGTVCYMSPEEARGLSVDARTDLFSLGVVLFEAASGHRPFSGSVRKDIMNAIQHEEPPRLRELNADIPPELERIVHRLLAKSPVLRYAAAGELLFDLTALRAKPIPCSSTLRPSPGPRCSCTRQCLSPDGKKLTYMDYHAEQTLDTTWTDIGGQRRSLGADNN